MKQLSSHNRIEIAKPVRSYRLIAKIGSLRLSTGQSVTYENETYQASDLQVGLSTKRTAAVLDFGGADTVLVNRIGDYDQVLVSLLMGRQIEVEAGMGDGLFAGVVKSANIGDTATVECENIVGIYVPNIRATKANGLNHLAPPGYRVAIPNGVLEFQPARTF